MLQDWAGQSAKGPQALNARLRESPSTAIEDGAGTGLAAAAAVGSSATARAAASTTGTSLRSMDVSLA